MASHRRGTEYTLEQMKRELDVDIPLQARRKAEDTGSELPPVPTGRPLLLGEADNSRATAIAEAKRVIDEEDAALSPYSGGKPWRGQASSLRPSPPGLKSMQRTRRRPRVQAASARAKEERRFQQGMLRAIQSQAPQHLHHGFSGAEGPGKQEVARLVLSATENVAQSKEMLRSCTRAAKLVGEMERLHITDILEQQKQDGVQQVKWRSEPQPLPAQVEEKGEEQNAPAEGQAESVPQPVDDDAGSGDDTDSELLDPPEPELEDVTELSSDRIASRAVEVVSALSPDLVQIADTARHLLSELGLTQRRPRHVSAHANTREVRKALLTVQWLQKKITWDLEKARSHMLTANQKLREERRTSARQLKSLRQDLGDAQRRLAEQEAAMRGMESSLGPSRRESVAAGLNRRSTSVLLQQQLPDGPLTDAERRVLERLHTRLLVRIDRLSAAAAEEATASPRRKVRKGKRDRLKEESELLQQYQSVLTDVRQAEEARARSRAASERSKVFQSLTCVVHGEQPGGADGEADDLFSGEPQSSAVGRREEAQISGLLAECARAFAVMHVACAGFADVLSEAKDHRGPPHQLGDRWLGLLKDGTKPATAPAAGADVPRPFRVEAVRRMQDAARAVDAGELGELIRSRHQHLLKMHRHEHADDLGSNEPVFEESDGEAEPEEAVQLLESVPPSPSHVIAAAWDLARGEKPELSAARAAALAHALDAGHQPLHTLRTGMATLDPNALTARQLIGLSEVMASPELDPRVARTRGPALEAVAEWLIGVAQASGAATDGIPKPLFDDAGSLASLSQVTEFRLRPTACSGAYTMVRSCIGHLGRALGQALASAKPQKQRSRDKRKAQAEKGVESPKAAPKPAPEPSQ
eukprot:TRINITY_DN32090_c0_g1_i1.p1 TRINITY_DN32090_c0_g1~~TRINITY_DN32090_c0_g1_i1.p1  ORF type:complete len:872 (+),score=288.62 TRINITY_DN32090_c0_g1_i1:74-2689(+)